MKWSPKNAPKVRKETLQVFNSTIGSIQRDITNELRDEAEAYATGVANAINAAELYWVTTDMYHVALDASADLPPWDPETTPPTQFGLLLWETPLPPLPVHEQVVGGTGDGYVEMPIDGVVWATYGDTLQITTLAKWTRLAEQISADLPVMYRTEVVRLLERFPNALWVAGEDVTININELVDSDTHEKSGLVALMGATWTLMQQPAVATPRTVSGGANKRTRLRPDHQVTIIELRRPKTVNTEPSETGRTYTHRWYVRGHWRQQAHGPNKSKRTLTWIPSYIKGPEGAPLLIKERVNVWRR